MKIRLQVQPGSEAASTFEHPGPSFQMGRDPAAELPFQGPAGEAVSWRHARVDLSPDGAFLHDLQSSNGTYVNGQRIQGRAALRIGSQISLGQAGPRLLVIDLALTAAPSPQHQPTAPARERPSTRLWAGGNALLGAVIVLGVLVLVLGLLVWNLSSRVSGLAQRADALDRQVADLGKPGASPLEKSQEQLTKQISELSQSLALLFPRKQPLVTPVSAPPPPEKPAEKDKPTKPAVPEKPPEPPRPPVVSVRRAALATVGGAVEPHPSLLVARQDGESWQRLDRGARVQSSDLLLSLPTMRTMLRLDSGLPLVLWGDVDGLTTPLPVLEARVVLHQPASDVAADLTIDRGRVVVGGKENGKAVVRIRFRDYIWDVLLPDAASAVAVELRTAPAPDEGKAGEPLPPARLLLALRGGARAREWKTPPEFPNPEKFACLVLPAARAYPLWPTLASFWAGKRDQLTKETVQDLDKFHDRLVKDAGPLEAALERTWRASGSSLSSKALAVFCLPGVDAVASLIRALEDDKHAEIRSGALVALRHWAGCGTNHLRRLTALLRDASFSGAQADALVKLLRPYSEEEVSRPETLALLVKLLEDDRLALRQAALWRLLELFPGADTQIVYDPAGKSSERAGAVKQWQRLVERPK